MTTYHGSPELRGLVGEQRCLLDIDGLIWLHPLPHEVCEAVEDIPSLQARGVTPGTGEAAPATSAHRSRMPLAARRTPAASGTGLESTVLRLGSRPLLTEPFRQTLTALVSQPSALAPEIVCPLKYRLRFPVTSP